MTLFPDESGIPGGAEPIGTWDCGPEWYHHGIQPLQLYDWQSWLPEYFDAVSIRLAVEIEQAEARGL